jgi:hypothetical protein
VGKVTLFKPHVGNVKIGQTIGGFTVINSFKYILTFLQNMYYLFLEAYFIYYHFIQVNYNLLEFEV